jgi:hypothetical protein
LTEHHIESSVGVGQSLGDVNISDRRHRNVVASSGRIKPRSRPFAPKDVDIAVAMLAVDAVRRDPWPIAVDELERTVP